MEFIIINQRKVPFELRKSSRAKHLRLQISASEAKVILVAPRLVLTMQINRFLKQQMPWIEKHWSKLEQQIKKRPEFNYEAGEFFYYFGEKVQLVLHPSEKKRPRVQVRANQLIIFLHHLISSEKAPHHIKKAIETFYKKKASEVIHDRLQHFNEFYGFKYGRVT